MADYLKTDEDVANYLTLVLEENDPAELTLAHEKIHQASAKKMAMGKLFPYLAGFKQRASGPQTIEYKIGEVFSEIQSGYNLRDVIDRIDELRFGSQAQKHELSHLYEAKIKNMGKCCLHFSIATRLKTSMIQLTPSLLQPLDADGLRGAQFLGEEAHAQLFE
jgi:hypothetical protein